MVLSAPLLFLILFLDPLVHIDFFLFMLESLSSLLRGSPFQWPQIFFIQAGSGAALNSLVRRFLEVSSKLPGPVNQINCNVIPDKAWLVDSLEAAQKYLKAENDLLVLLLDHVPEREAEFYKQFGPRSLFVIAIDDVGDEGNLDEIPADKTILVSGQGDSFFGRKAEFLGRKFGMKALERELVALIAQQAHDQLSHHLHQLQSKATALLPRQQRLKDPSNGTRLLTRYLQHLETVFEGQLDGEAAGIGYAFGHELPAALEAIPPASKYSFSELKILFKNSKGLKEAAPFSSNRPFQALVQAELRNYAQVIEETFARILSQVKSIILIGKVDEESGEAFFDAQEDNVEGLKEELIATGLAPQINHHVLQVLDANAMQTHAFIQGILAMEESHICTNDPQFWRDCQRTFLQLQPDDVPFEAIKVAEEDPGAKGSVLDEFLALFRPSNRPFTNQKVFKPPETADKAPTPITMMKPSAVMTEELQFTLAVLKSYLAIVRRSLIDAIPKAIAHFLIKRSLQEFPAKLLPLSLKRLEFPTVELDAEINSLQKQIIDLESLLLKLINFQ